MSKLREINIPQVMSTELPEGKKVTPFGGVTRAMVDKVNDASYKGAVSHDGKWLINSGFLLDKLDIGKYKITHGLGYKNTCLSVSILEPPGTINILENHTHYFVVETLVDRVSTDRDFSFCLTVVISPPK